MTTRVLITCPNLLQFIDDYRDRFEQWDIAIETPAVTQQLSEGELVAIIGRFDGVIVGDDPFTSRVIEKGERLKVLSKWGVGVDNIDLDAARRRGVTVTNTPGVFDDEVADVCVGYLVLLARHLHRIDEGVREGDWPKPIGGSLAGRTLGIVGLGGTGSALARRALAMRMVVIGTEVDAERRATASQMGVEIVDLDRLIASADFISLNCSLTDTTRHLLNRERFASMRRGVRIVNVARGGLIDEDALVGGLTDGIVAGAALDVFAEEPLPDDHPLRSFDSVILGSHNASNTEEAVRRVNELAIDNLVKELDGGGG